MVVRCRRISGISTVYGNGACIAGVGYRGSPGRPKAQRSPLDSRTHRAAQIVRGNDGSGGGDPAIADITTVEGDDARLRRGGKSGNRGDDCQHDEARFRPVSRRPFHASMTAAKPNNTKLDGSGTELIAKPSSSGVNPFNCDRAKVIDPPVMLTVF